MKHTKKFIFILVVLVFFSCSQDLDFNQIKDYTAKPSYTSSLAFFTIKSTDFVLTPGAPSVTEIEEESDFKVFRNEYLRKNLIKIDFNFEIINEFNRDFTMEIALLNESNSVIYNLQDLKIDANNSNFSQTQTIDIVVNPVVKNFTRVRVKLRLDDATTPIDINDSGRFVFKSASTIYLETSLK